MSFWKWICCTILLATPTNAQDKLIVLSTAKCQACVKFEAESKLGQLKIEISRFKLVKLDDTKPVQRAGYLKAWKVKYYPAFILEEPNGRGYRIVRGYDKIKLIQELRKTK